MSYEVLSRKYRPRSFNELVGQKHVSQTLSNAIKLKRIAHSYLFAGLRGTGKTTTARIMAKELNGSDIKKISAGTDFDVVELDGASNRGIDEIRDLKESVKYPPVSGAYKIYIIDEVHMLTNEAFNALLKTLEEPPPYVVFIMATTDPFKLPATILSRSQRFEFKRLSKNDIHKHLSYIINQEGLEHDSDSLNIISSNADGSMRDALSLLDQVIAFSNGKIECSMVEEMLGTISQENLMEILINIFNGKKKDVMTRFNELRDSGISFSNFVSSFNTVVCNSINYLITKSNKGAFSNEFISLLENSSFKVKWLVEVLESGSKCQIKLKNSENPNIIIELFLLKLMQDKIENSEEAIEDIKALSLNSNNEKSNQKLSTKSVDNNNESFGNNKDLSDSKSVQKSESSVDQNNNQKWSSFLNNIENSFPKLAGFLDSSNVRFNKSNVTVEFQEATQFQVNSLEKDKEVIVKEINSYYNITIKELIFEVKEITRKEKEKDTNKNIDHPLTNQILESFDGEIIR